MGGGRVDGATRPLFTLEGMRPAPTATPTAGRFIRLSIADFPTDDCDSPTRMVWINPSQIETVIEHVTWNELEPVLWLEITLASGIVLYNLVGTAAVDDLATATATAIERLVPA